MPNQALEQTHDSVLRYGEVGGCALLNFSVLPCGSDALCGNLESAVDRPFSVPQLEPLMTATPYTAVIRRDGRWWIGWVEEVPGVNSQGETREELLSNLREALAEAIEMNREDARKAAGEQFEEVALQP